MFSANAARGRTCELGDQRPFPAAGAAQNDLAPGDLRGDPRWRPIDPEILQRCCPGFPSVRNNVEWMPPIGGEDTRLIGSAVRTQESPPPRADLAGSLRAPPRIPDSIGALVGRLTGSRGTDDHGKLQAYYYGPGNAEKTKTVQCNSASPSSTPIVFLVFFVFWGGGRRCIFTWKGQPRCVRRPGDSVRNRAFFWSAV